MLRNIWNYRLKGGICLYPVFTDPKQPHSCFHKNSHSGCKAFHRERLPSLTVTFGFELRTGFLCHASLYLLTKQYFVSTCPSSGCYFGAVDSVDFSVSGMIWNVKRKDYPNPSLLWNWTECPFLWHQNVACCWKPRAFNRDQGRNFSFSYFPLF